MTHRDFSANSLPQGTLLIKASRHTGVYELVVGKQGKKEYPHLDKKASTREETHEWKRMSRYDGY